MKYDKETTQALKDSIAHHEDNLHKLRTAKGEFKWREMKIYTEDCALCKLFKACHTDLVCPLKNYEQRGCNDEGSTWYKIYNSKTRPEAIKAEENMVRVLKEVLGEEEFEVGDTVTTEVKDCYLTNVIGKIVAIMHGLSFPYRVKILTGKNKGYEGVYDKESLKLVKEDIMYKKLTQYDDLAQRIGNVKAWDKEADNITTELYKTTKHLGYLQISIPLDYAQTAFHIIKWEGSNWKEIATFAFRGQCEKLEAFKKALMWLLDHSDIKKVEERTYKVGNRFLIEGKEYLLAEFKYNECALVQLVSGNRWVSSQKVKDSQAITEEELLKISDGDKATLIE